MRRGKRTLSQIRSTLVPKRLRSRSFLKNHGLRKVVVLGAGASKSFGLPLATELLPAMIKWHQGQGRGSKLKDIFEFLEYFYPSFRRSRSRFPPAEDVLGMMEVALEYAKIRSSISRGNHWREELLKSIQSRFKRLLGEYLWAFQDGIKLSDLSTLRKFVRTNGTGIIYITFNYDLLLETALSAEKIPFCYALQFESGGVAVLKPHGSINWFAKTTKLGPGVRAFDLGDGRVDRGWRKEKQSDRIQVCTTLSPGKLGFRNWKEPVIIPPTPTKQIENQDLRRIWASFSSAIHTTKRLEIIGYSLPAADRLARLVLRKAGPPHSQNRQITIVNPGKVKKIYRDAISPKCNFARLYFNDWVAHGCGETGR
jgi:hypothetical protein